MKLLRTAAVAALAKKAYDEARKPHNQRKIKGAVDQIRARTQKKGHAPGGSAGPTGTTPPPAS